MGAPKGQIMSELRVLKDLQELRETRFQCYPQASFEFFFPDGPSNLLHISVRIRLHSGFYAGGTFIMSLRVPHSYPFRPPEVFCEARCWHPNVDVETGRLRHPLLERDWKPVLSMNTVIFGLQLAFIEPIADTEFVANALAQHTLARSPADFAAHVAQTMRGGFWFGYEFASHDAAAQKTAHCSTKRQREQLSDNSDDNDNNNSNNNNNNNMIDVDTDEDTKHSRCNAILGDNDDSSHRSQKHARLEYDAPAMDPCQQPPFPTAGHYVPPHHRTTYYLPPHNYPLSM